MRAQTTSSATTAPTQPSRPLAGRPPTLRIAATAAPVPTPDRVREGGHDADWDLLAVHLVSALEVLVDAPYRCGTRGAPEGHAPQTQAAVDVEPVEDLEVAAEASPLLEGYEAVRLLASATENLAERLTQASLAMRSRPPLRVERPLPKAAPPPPRQAAERALQRAAVQLPPVEHLQQRSEGPPRAVPSQARRRPPLVALGWPRASCRLGRCSHRCSRWARTSLGPSSETARLPARSSETLAAAPGCSELGSSAEARRGGRTCGASSRRSAPPLAQPGRVRRPAPSPPAQ